MTHDSATTEDAKLDPDPLVVDLLVNLTATAIAGTLSKVVKRVVAARREAGLAEMAEDSNDIGKLEELTANLGNQVDQARDLVAPGSKRELGGQLLLDRARLEKYEELRDSLFEQVRQVDELSKKLSQDGDSSANGRLKGVRLPPEFKTQLDFVERRLRDARVASVAAEAFAEISAAVVTMTAILKQLRDQRGRYQL